MEFCRRRLLLGLQPRLDAAIDVPLLRSFATKTTATSRKTRVSTFAASKPRLRRNSKRINAAIEQTNIRSAALALSTTKPLHVLGLDINTNSTGYAVLGADGRVVTWGHIATTKFPSADILGIAHAISEQLPRILETVQLSTTPCEQSCVDARSPLPVPVPEWRVGIEDFMRMYSFGKFHNKGIFQLAQLNGIVSYACWQRFGCRAVHTHPSAARGLFGIVASSNRKTTSTTSSGTTAITDTTSTTKSRTTTATTMVKAQVMQFVLQQEQDSLACQELRQHHVNRAGQWTEAAFDIADAYVVALYTRWMALQELLQQDDELLHQFSDVYMALAVPTLTMNEEKNTTKPKTKAKAPSVEEKALLGMADDAKQLYLKELFALGVAEWIKTHHHHR